MAEAAAPLLDDIRRRIAVGGPMPVADYMRLCLTHPEHGYYVKRDPLGSGGDFITAPEISQMFGELIGVWMAAVWRQMGAPENFRIVELGPGRGTLLDDALRAVKKVPGFGEAAVLHLVEISPALREVQERRLTKAGLAMLWHERIEDVPGGPSIIVANEFIDALPVHQAVRKEDGWHERVVALNAEGNLTFDSAREPLQFFESALPCALRAAPLGSIYEWRADSIALELGRRTRDEGAALIIDYGHAHSGLGDTLQAVARHAFTDPLRAPGMADLTAHVDFEALVQCAEAMGARVHGPIPQRDLFLRLGIEQRAAALKSAVSKDKAADIELALSRLIAGGAIGGPPPSVNKNAMRSIATGMGELFKAIAIAAPKFGALPGFETMAGSVP
jgi:NADH dehydrogenase [ubiquinone] 1 alpha subcomplex assembly factor 7